jgi:cyclopropane fatty-acyl-phospholipid synthase-like methyltransferase
MEESQYSARHSLVGPGDLWDVKRRFQIEFLQGAGLKPHHRLLDFGCGTLRGGLPLIEYLDQGNYVGLDVRTETLKEACNELEESGLDQKTPILIHCHDLSSLNFRKGFDFIWAFSVLIHLADDKLEEMLAFAASNLSLSGKIFANVKYGDNADGYWRNFPSVARSQAFYLQTFEKHRLQVRDIGALREFGHIARPRSEKEELLQRMLEARALDSF